MKRLLYVGIPLFLLLIIAACSSTAMPITDSTSTTVASHTNENVDYSSSELKKVYFAGGCFWGVEAYMERIYGVYDATSGYANGTGEHPTYKEVMQGIRDLLKLSR